MGFGVYGVWWMLLRSRMSLRFVYLPTFPDRCAIVMPVVQLIAQSLVQKWFMVCVLFNNELPGGVCFEPTRDKIRAWIPRSF